MRSSESEDNTGTRGPSSQRITVYFTRAQAEALVELFDQNYLLGLMGGRASPLNFTEFDTLENSELSSDLEEDPEEDSEEDLRDYY
jgi:hypothetical protein